MLDAVANLPELLIQKLNLRNQEEGVLGSCVTRAWSQDERLSLQDQEHIVDRQLPDSVYLENALNAKAGHPCTFGGCGGGGQQIPHQSVVRGRTDRQHLRVVPMELLPQSVGSVPEFDLQLVFKPGKFAQSQDFRTVDLDKLVTVPVGAQRRGQHQRISGIVLRSRDGEAIAKPVHLLWVDRKDVEAVFDKGFDEGAPSDLDTDGDQGRLARRSLFELVDQGDETLAAVSCVVLLDRSTIIVKHGDAVILRSPIDTDKITERFLHDLPPEVAL